MQTAFGRFFICLLPAASWHQPPWFCLGGFFIPGSLPTSTPEVMLVFKLPALTILEAYGLALVVQVAKGTSNNIEKSEEFASIIAKGFWLPPAVSILLLLVGWVAKGWM